MKKIVINSDNRRFNISSIVVGYLEENKEEVLEFEIPEKYAEYGKKACFSANGQTFAKNFDDVISNKLTITRDISQFKELDMTIEFFKIENEDEIVARTSILHILIENAIICDDDIKPDEPKIIILDNLIDEVTKLDVLVTKNEKKREEYYQEIQKKVDNGDFNGATFTPSVDVDGNISWTNDKNLSNPTTQNIKGPKGEKGDTYNLTEQDKKDISSITVESSESSFNQYYNGKLQSFNENSTSKTNDYNTNATNKTNEFNTNATSKVNEFNTHANNKIAEYDLHSQELDNKIVSTRNELERVKNDILETGTDTDTFVHLEDSAMAEYQELSVDGVCEQVTTTGKNLLKSNLLPITKNGITISENDNGDIVVNGTITGISSGYVSFFIGDVFTVEEGTYTSSVQNKKNGIGLNTAGFGGALNITMADNVNFKTATATETQIINPQINIRYDAGTFNNYIFNPMLEKSSSATSYEPYTGGQPSPSPEYPQEIKTIENSLKITSCNKNLLKLGIGSINKNNTTLTINNDILNFKSTGKTNWVGYGIDNNLRSANYGDYITWGGQILKAGTYTLTYKYLSGSTTTSTVGSNFLSIIVYGRSVGDTDRVKTKLCRVYVKDTSSSATFTIDEDKEINAVIYLYASSATIDINFQIQLEKGLIATLYEQHLETQIQANLPEGEFIGKISDTYKDTLKVEYNETDGQYHLNLYKRVYKNNSYNGESYNYYISTTARKDGNIECGELQTGQVVYYVGDETIIDLGVVDMPITYNEITNLFTDSNLSLTINAKYYRNFISTVRNLQVNEKALKQELIDINARLSALETAQTNVVSESEVVE